MESTNHHFTVACTENCSRRSFFKKSIPGSLSIALSAGFFVNALSSCSDKKKTKKEILAQLDGLVDKHMLGACSQTSFYALNLAFDLKAEKFVNALASFPGVAMRGETCGAVSGSLAAIGMALEKGDIHDSARQRLSREPSIQFCSGFEEEYGSTRCRDVIAHVSGKEYEITKPEDYGKLAEEGVYQHCPGVIKTAIHLAADVIIG